jgi:hypothetical protein
MSSLFVSLRVYLRDSAIQLCLDDRIDMLSYFLAQIYEPLLPCSSIPDPETFAMYLTTFMKDRGGAVRAARGNYFPEYLIPGYVHSRSQCYWWLKEYAFKHFLDRARDSDVDCLPKGNYRECENPLDEDSRQIARETGFNPSTLPGRIPDVYYPAGRDKDSLTYDDIVITNPAHYAYLMFSNKTRETRKPMSEICYANDSLHIGNSLGRWHQLGDIDPLNPHVVLGTVHRDLIREGEDLPGFELNNTRATKRARKGDDE